MLPSALFYLYFNRSIVQGGASLFTEKVLVDKLAKAVEEYNWPSMITSIEDQLKEEKYV